MGVWSFVDEREILKKLLKDKRSIKNNTLQKLIVYIKYLKENNKTKTEVRQEVDNLMNNYYQGFVMADWDSQLQSLVNKYTQKGKREFREIRDINITKKELNFIRSFENLEIEKLLFVMLAVNKSTFNPKNEKINPWVNCDSQTLFSLSKFKYLKGSRFEQREYLIYDLAKKTYNDINKEGKIEEKHIIETSNICDATSIKLLYIDSNYDIEGLNIKIDEYIEEDLVCEYLLWRGEKVIKCEECSKLEIYNGKNPPKKCKKCAKKIKNEQNKSYYNKN